MDGVDLVTEGTLTLGRVASLLEAGTPLRQLRANAATRLLTMLLDSDVVQFVVGTRINQAHQDPNIPMELELRRRHCQKVAALLESWHVKEVQVRFL